MLSDPDVRASDRDREAAVAVLRDAYVAGRLNLDELRHRAGAAYSAQTWGDLRKLAADLPAGAGVVPDFHRLQTHVRFTGGWRYAPPRLTVPWLPAVLMWVAVVAHAWVAVAALLLVVLLQSAMCAARVRARQPGGTAESFRPCRPKQR